MPGCFGPCKGFTAFKWVQHCNSAQIQERTCQLIGGHGSLSIKLQQFLASLKSTAQDCPNGQTRSSSHLKKILIIAGPNGAGKTTFARDFLPAEAQTLRFINAESTNASPQAKALPSKPPYQVRATCEK